MLSLSGAVKRRRFSSIFSKLVLLVLVALGLGFFAFLWLLPDEEVVLDRNADGIVVLTGGTSRVADALELLAAGRGKRLLISGVNPERHRRIAARPRVTTSSWHVDLIICHHPRQCRGSRWRSIKLSFAGDRHVVLSRTACAAGFPCFGRYADSFRGLRSTAAGTLVVERRNHAAGRSEYFKFCTPICACARPRDRRDQAYGCRLRPPDQANSGNLCPSIPQSSRVPAFNAR
jgi:hypothetical protein